MECWKFSELDSGMIAHIMNVLNVSVINFICHTNKKSNYLWLGTTNNLSLNFIVWSLRFLCSCLGCFLIYVAFRSPMFWPWWCTVMSSCLYLCRSLTKNALLFLLFSLIKFKIWIKWHFSMRTTPHSFLCAPIAPHSDN